jgi:hypothetical protein
MATHKHDWLVNYHSFDPIEHGQPYTVFYCPCGERKTEVMTDEQIESVCHAQGWPVEKAHANFTSAEGVNE